MALKVWDGFDHYDALTDFNARSGFLQWTTNTTPTFVTGRNGFGLAIEFASGIRAANPLLGVFGQRVASAFVGFACNMQSGAGGTFYFQDTIAGANQITIVFNPSNFSVAIYLGNAPSDFPAGTLLYQSANNVWAAATYNYIEMWPVINGSTGSVTVDINGTTVAQVTGVNTQKTANTWWDALQIITVGPDQITFDDLYYADSTSGPGAYPCNSFLGDSRVATVFASGNDSVQWTPLTSTNWEEVAEVHMDSDTSYNYCSTPGDQDTYTFGPLAGTITVIYGVQVTGAYRKDDSGSRSIKQVVKSGGTSYFGTTDSIASQTYVYFTDAFILNPNTSANWTLSAVNAATYGVNLVS